MIIVRIRHWIFASLAFHDHIFVVVNTFTILKVASDTRSVRRVKLHQIVCEPSLVIIMCAHSSGMLKLDSCSVIFMIPYRIWSQKIFKPWRCFGIIGVHFYERVYDPGSGICRQMYKHRVYPIINLLYSSSVF